MSSISVQSTVIKILIFGGVLVLGRGCHLFRLLLNIHDSLRQILDLCTRRVILVRTKPAHLCLFKNRHCCYQVLTRDALCWTARRNTTSNFSLLISVVDLLISVGRCLLIRRFTRQNVGCRLLVDLFERAKILLGETQIESFVIQRFRFVIVQRLANTVQRFCDSCGLLDYLLRATFSFKN